MQHAEHCSRISAMSSLGRWQMKMTITLLAAAGIMAVGAGALYMIFVVNPIYTDTASVPSTPADAAPGPYTAAIGKTRGLIRKLLVDDNVTGLSIAVAVDGKIVWAEG